MSEFEQIYYEGMARGAELGEVRGFENGFKQGVLSILCGGVVAGVGAVVGYWYGKRFIKANGGGK